MAGEKDIPVFTKDNEGYFRFIENTMDETGITIEQLTSGLCNVLEWNELISGKYMNKLMMNRLLDRLGCNNLRCDVLLFGSEYDDWQMRMDIVFAINDGNKCKAAGILKKYAERKGIFNSIDDMECNDRLEYQFMFVMQAYIMMNGEYDRTEVIAKLQQAAALTIMHGTDVLIDSNERIVLSVQELDILLEFYYQVIQLAAKENNIQTICCYTERIQKIIDYIQSAEWFNILSKASILPKAAYYGILANQEKLHLKRENVDGLVDIADELSIYGRWLSDCDKVIETLRASGRIFYLAELCDVMENVVDRMEKLLSEDTCKGMKIDDRKSMIERHSRILIFIQNITGINRYTKNGVYMYLEPGVYRLEKVAAERRKLLGMTQSKLAEEICTTKTIRRLELGKSRPHGYNLYEILNKLELYSDFVLDEIVSYRAEDMKILEKVYDAISMNEIEKAEEFLHELENKVDMNYTKNKQTIERIKLNFNYRRGEITKADYINALKDIIGYSVKYENIIKNPNTYLTDCETVMLQSIYTSEVNAADFLYLYGMVSAYECDELYIRKIELLKTVLASAAGNRADYKNSNKEFMDVIAANFRIKRIYNIARCVYGIWWNNDRQHKYSAQESRDMLNICVEIINFTKEYEHKDFFLKKKDSIF